MRILTAVIFPTEAKAYEGHRALIHLHDTGAITVHEAVVIERQADGTVAVKLRSGSDHVPSGVGPVLGAVIGALAGPVGVLFGATVGGVAGALGEAVRATRTSEYAEPFGKRLAPGTFAVLAEVHEDDRGPIDARMHELGGEVLRESRTHYLQQIHAQHENYRRAQVEEDARLRDSERAQQKELAFEASLDVALVKLRSAADAAAEQLDRTNRRLDEKLEALQRELAKADPEVRAELDERMSEIRRDLGERRRKLAHALEIAREALQHHA